MQIPIDPPGSYALSPIERKVKELLAQGMPHWQIKKTLHLGYKEYRDCVFQVRKQEAIMMSKLTNEQRAEIYRLCKEEGVPQLEVATMFDVSQATVCQTIKKLDMLSAADAEDKPESVEQTADPTVMTEEHTVEIPAAVIKAVEDKIEMIQDLMGHNAERIESLKRQNAELMKTITDLESWVKEVNA